MMENEASEEIMRVMDNNLDTRLNGIVNFSDILVGDFASLDKFLPIVKDKTSSVELLFDSNALIDLYALCFGHNVNEQRRKLAALLFVLRNFSQCKLGSYHQNVFLEFVLSHYKLSSHIKQIITFARAKAYTAINTALTIHTLSKLWILHYYINV